MSTAERFAIHCYANSLTRPRNDFGLSGKATLTVTPEQVIIEGPIQRSFRIPAAGRVSIALADVCNVWSDRDEFIFDVRDADKLRSIGFRVSGPNDARRLHELLPRQQSSGYAQLEADRKLFLERINHGTPGSPITWTMIVLNVLIFLAMALGGIYNHGPEAENSGLIHWGANYGPYTLEGQWWRLLTSMFLHGGWVHIGMNMAALYSVGVFCERLFGSRRFLLLYLVAGVSGSAASVLLNPGVNSVGASGAIFGIMGGLLAFIRNPDSGVPPTIVGRLRRTVSTFVLLNIGAGIIYPHIDNAAHIGGLVGGFFAGMALARSLHLAPAR
jgi:rhomboid protease GluP